MPKPVETMSDHELLVELVREKRRADRERAVKTAVALAVLAVIVVLCVIYVPRIAQTVRQFQAVMDRLNRLKSSVTVRILRTGMAGTLQTTMARKMTNKLLIVFMS